MEVQEKRLEKLVIKTYQYFYQKIYDKPKYRFVETDSQLTLIDNFITSITSKVPQDSIGEKFMFDFFSFQFSHWLDIEDYNVLRRNTGVPIQLAWLIGAKAMSRWKGRKSGAIISSKRDMLSVGINPSGIAEEKETVWEGTMAYEEVQKELHLNTDLGLAYCMERTTLINPKSEHCANCKFQAQCEELLKHNNYNLYVERGYER